MSDVPPRPPRTPPDDDPLVHAFLEGQRVAFSRRDILHGHLHGTAYLDAVEFAKGLNPDSSSSPSSTSASKSRPSKSDYLVSIAKDKENYEQIGTLDHAEITKIRDFVRGEHLIGQCFSVLRSEIIGEGVKVVSHDSATDDDISTWAWDDDDTRTDIRMIAETAYEYLTTYGFLVVALPVNPLGAMIDHTKTDAAYAFTAPEAVYKKTNKASLRFIATDNRPLAAAARMRNAWVCGAKIIHPADLECNYTIYKSHTMEPKYYVNPELAKVAGKASPIQTLLKSYRIVTYATDVVDWIPNMRIRTPIASLEPIKKEVTIRETLDLRALASESAGILLVEFNLPQKQTASITHGDHILNAATGHDKKTTVTDEYVPLAADAGTYIVPPSLAQWNDSTEQRALELNSRTLLNSAVFDCIEGDVAIDRVTVDDLHELKRSAYDMPLTANTFVASGLIKLPPGARKTEYVAPKPHFKETADRAAVFRNTLFNYMGLRENTFGAAVVTNAAAGGVGARAITAAQTTTKNPNNKADAKRPNIDEPVPSAVVHASFIEGARMTINGFFEFFVSEALYPLEHVHREYVKVLLSKLNDIEVFNISWDKVVDEIVRSPKEEHKPLVPYILGLHKTETDKDEIAALVQRNIGFFRGLFATIEHATDAHVNISLKFDVPLQRDKRERDERFEQEKKEAADAAAIAEAAMPEDKKRKRPELTKKEPKKAKAQKPKKSNNEEKKMSPKKNKKPTKKKAKKGESSASDSESSESSDK